ncbi:MAG: TIGR00266 family protein [Acidimicrobiales bacterium]
MELQVRHNPSFSVARALLGAGESIRAESGAMMAMAADTRLDAKIEGGLVKGLKRSVLGGESLFITTATAGPQGGWIDLAPSLPGDLTVVSISPTTPLLVQKGSFLCAEQGVEIDTKWGGFKSMFGGEGAFLLRASGQGEIVLSTYGALDRFTLQAGQEVVVDSNHMVAFSESVTMQLKKASDTAWKSMKSGEGLVFLFTGPGELMMQSRNPDEIVRYIVANMPGSRN